MFESSYVLLCFFFTYVIEMTWASASAIYLSEKQDAIDYWQIILPLWSNNEKKKIIILKKNK